MHSKRIVVDYDDTIALNKNRDWVNAIPNTPLIKKMNKLYYEGWTIDIFTARGSISCKTRKAASDKYRDGIETWLTKHKVKYNILSFDKPLAAYYIDDKGISPELFLETDIRPLKGGLSGSDIYTDGTLVHKTDANSHAVHQFFLDTQAVTCVPHVERVVGETITMEYINHNKDYFKDNHFIALGLIQDTLEKYKTLPIKKEYNFVSYKTRIVKHNELANGLFSEVVYSLGQYNLDQSFSHGDFGITNFLFNEHKLCLIDPIPDMFGCTELDAAKFCASLWINKYKPEVCDLALNAMSVYNNIKMTKFRTLVAAEMVRVYKYHPNKNFIEECVSDVFR